jgi:hypothetical protein
MVIILFKFLSAFPRLFANRPTVVDPRVHEVRSQTRKASDYNLHALVAQFINKIKSEKGYQRIGAVG